MTCQQRLTHFILLHRTRTFSSGFTLIELLVVIVIVGLLSAIALPSFLNQANKARQTEAKTYVGTINRGQQAYFMEHAQFGSLAELEVNIPPATSLYQYVTGPEAGGLGAHTTATPQFNSTAAYSGRVWLLPASGGTSSVLCEDRSGVPPTIVGTTCP